MLKTTPGYRLNEYKLVIPLPDALQQKVIAIRTEFGEKYSYKPDTGRAHVILVMFSQLEMMVYMISFLLTVTLLTAIKLLSRRLLSMKAILSSRFLIQL